MTATPPTYSEQLAALAAELLGDVDLDARLELLGVMDPDDMRASLAWLVAYAPRTFDFALVRDRKLVERLQERLDEAEVDDDPEPYCSACGATIGIFFGHGDAWLHYTGEGTVASPVKLFDAGHEAAVAWRAPGASVVTAPAELPRVRCTRTVWTDGSPESCGLPVDHDPDEKCPGNPHARPAAGMNSEDGAQ